MFARQSGETIGLVRQGVITLGELALLFCHDG